MSEIKPTTNDLRTPESGVVIDSGSAANSFMEVQKKLAKIIILQPAAATLELIYRGIRLISYAPLQAIFGSANNEDAKTYMAVECIKTLQATRNVLAVPSKIAAALNETTVLGPRSTDVQPGLTPPEYLKTEYDISFQYFASEHFSRDNFKVITPRQIHEMPVFSDPSLLAVMGSHFLKSGLMGINFGCPNVALFTTHESSEDAGSVYKVDAKSMKREDMQYKDTHGKLQSGYFFIPTNLPKEAIVAVEEAAKKFQGRRDYTCVNTNCRILKEAGFTVENMDLEDCYLPTSCLENFLFRNVYYKGQKVHFDILKTTPLSLEEYYDKIDAAVITTPVRHHIRDQDPEENKKARDIEAKKIIAAEKKSLSQNFAQNIVNLVSDKVAEAREVKISVTSYFGDLAARVWGRHSLYEINLADMKTAIKDAFGSYSLKPFPMENPSFMTRMKRDFLFSQTAINFLRTHMIDKYSKEKLNAKELLDLLKSTGGARLNYTLFADRIVFGRVSLPQAEEGYKQAADWALSKHALLAGREEVLCAGEIWYDQASDLFLVNNDSGTYITRPDDVKKMVALANEMFKTDRFAAFINHESGG